MFFSEMQNLGYYLSKKKPEVNLIFVRNELEYCLPSFNHFLLLSYQQLSQIIFKQKHWISFALTSTHLTIPN